MASLVSVNVGMPKDVDWHGKTVHTGIWKHPVHGPRMVRRLNIDGDGQGDTAGHGGEQRVVPVYQLDSYAYWKSHLGRDDFVYGQFGENLTVDGLLDDEVCIGDRYRIGEAEFEVTQPRVTCYRVGIRLNQADMPNLLVGHHRPGFYLRVIAEGHIEAGDQIVKTATGRHHITIAATNALLYLPDRDLDLMRKALDIPALSPGWQGSFRDLVAAADSATDRPAPTAPPPATRGWPGFRPLRVARVVEESDTIASIYLAADDGQPLPAARGGQYLALRVPGVAQPAPVRSYSLSSAPGAGTYRLSIKREDHGLVSNYLHTKLHVGAVLDAAAPRGAFVLNDSDSPVLLISAGVGVTPVLAMLHQLAAQHSQREVWWIHGSREPREHALAAEAHQLLTSLPHAHEHVYYSAAAPPLVAAAHATSGRLSAEAITALDPPPDAHAYLCGPSGFMTDVQSALNAAGIDPRNIHIEIFGALSAINPGITNPSAVTPHLPPGQPGSGPTITFARSDLSVPFDTAVASVLEMAELCDVPTRWACRTGVCHTCATQLLSGEVTYSPEPLERPVAGEALICCSRPATDLVLDM
jgi:ferredoxin-NADP reductase/MOSC domain-containing protein YiiM/ferredoxin